MLKVHMIKKFSFPKIKIWFEPMFFSGFFCGFERCGSAAFPDSCPPKFSERKFRRVNGGTSSPPAAAKCVRTNSRILHKRIPKISQLVGFWGFGCYSFFMLPETPIENISGVTPALAKKFQRLGISTIRDLLFHFPFQIGR